MELDEETRKKIEAMMEDFIEHIPDHMDNLEEIVGHPLRKSGHARCRSCKEFFHWNQLSGDLLCVKCEEKKVAVDTAKER